MYELVQLSDRCYFIESPAKIGLVRIGESEVCLIDSGSDKDAAKKVLRHVTENGWTLTAIYNTHSHADHIGGNAFLQERTGCRIFAPAIEQAFTEAPILEPTLLYGGCPPTELQHKFLLAKESKAELLTDAALPEGMTAFALPGHALNMVGYRVGGVAYLADALSSAETLDKYKLGYLHDVQAYLETLMHLQTMQADVFVPAHAAPTADIAPLARYNADTVMAIGDTVVSLLDTPLTAEELLSRVFDVYGLTMNPVQYVLLGSTLRSYLTWLKGLGRVQFFIENNRFLWSRV